MKFLLDRASSRHLLCLFLALTLSGCSSARMQQAERAPTPVPSALASPQNSGADKIDRPTSEPYKGDLSIFEEPERDRKLQIERVLDVLGIREGSAVADIGAGSGWFTVRAARRAGEKGAIYAVEINPDYLKHIEERAGQEKLLNIKTVLGTEDDPRLPEKSVDAVLLLKTYHEIAEPVRLLVNLRRSLREGARVGVIDRNGKGEDHGVKREVVIEEAKRAGYALVEEHDFVKPDGMDYFLVFKAQAGK